MNKFKVLARYIRRMLCLSAICVALIAMIAPVNAAVDVSYSVETVDIVEQPPAFDFQGENVSPVTHDQMTYEKDVEIETRDGTIVRANVFRPTVEGYAHSDTMVFIYLPGEKILINADLYIPGRPLDRYSLAGIRALDANLERLGLDVERHVGIHGQISTRDQYLEDLESSQ